jgi:hypothetical protein
MAKLIIDPKTGRKRRVDPKRSLSAKKGARKRKGKKVSAATKRKIRKSQQTKGTSIVHVHHESDHQRNAKIQSERRIQQFPAHTS